jgi:hypothetical protein
MTFSQILDRTYRLTRAYLRSFLAIALIPAAAFVVFMVAMEAAIFVPLIRQFPNPPSPEGMNHLLRPAIILPWILLFIIFHGVVFALYFAAAIHAATQADRGRAVPFREAYRVAWANAGRYLLLMLLIYAIAFLPALVIELAGFGGAALLSLENANTNPAVFLLIPLAMLLFLAAFVYATIMGLRLSLAFPACVAEGLPARAALRRSSHLTLGAKGRIFLVLLVVYAILYVLVMVVEFVLVIFAAIGILAVSVLQVHLSTPLSYVAMGVAILLLAALFLLYIALTWAVMTTTLAVLYHDQCLRQDFPPPTPIQPPLPPGAPA